jgi:hypothetical protein
MEFNALIIVLRKFTAVYLQNAANFCSKVNGSFFAFRVYKGHGSVLWYFNRLSTLICGFIHCLVNLSTIIIRRPIASSSLHILPQ